jgi:hypothetical protein
MRIDREFAPKYICYIEGWGAAIAAAATVAGSAISASAAGNASSQQVAAEEQAQSEQMQMFQQEQSNEQPYMQGGAQAENQLNYLLGNGTQGQYQGTSSAAGGFGSLNQPFNMDTFKSMSPQYQFNLQQGGQGVLNQNSSAQGAESGAALSGLESFNQNYANNSYNSAFQNYQTQQNNVFNRLSGLATLGSNAGSNSATGASNFSQAIGNTTSSIGASQAAGTVGAANAISGGLQSAGNTIYGQSQLNQLLNQGSTVAYNGVGAGGGVNGIPNGSVDYCDYGLKKNIEPIYFDGMSKLAVYEFHYKDQDDSEDKWQGFIAQDVRDIFPDAVSVGPKGYLKVDYNAIPTEVRLTHGRR